MRCLPRHVFMLGRRKSYRWLMTMSFSFLDVFGFQFAKGILRYPSALSQANRGRRGVRRDAAGCARVGADGCRGFARGRALAGSGRFRRKRALILPWVLGFCVVFGGGRSLSASPTWGNVCAVRRFGPIRPAKPLRSCKRGLLVLRVAHLNVCFGSVGAGHRHCECDSASVGLDELWLVSQPARCYQVSAILFRDILSDIIWPKSGQNVKMSRKNVTKTQVRPHGREVGELCQGWRGDEPRV